MTTNCTCGVRLATGAVLTTTNSTVFDYSFYRYYFERVEFVPSNIKQVRVLREDKANGLFSRGRYLSGVSCFRGARSRTLPPVHKPSILKCRRGCGGISRGCSEFCKAGSEYYIGKASSGVWKLWCFFQKYVASFTTCSSAKNSPER